VDEDENGNFHQPVQMGEHDRFHVVQINFVANEKVVFFPRVLASHPSAYHFVNKSYLNGEEVLLQYTVNAI